MDILEGIGSFIGGIFGFGNDEKEAQTVPQSSDTINLTGMSDAPITVAILGFGAIILVILILVYFK